MILTLILYLLIPLSCMFSTWLVPRRIYVSNDIATGRYLLMMSIPILIYTAFWGLRYNVGSDYLAYVDIYNYIDFYSSYEIGFVVLVKALKFLNLPPASLFVVTSLFIVIALSYLSKGESRSNAILLIVYSYTSTFIFFSQNGIRQAVAFSFVLILIKQISNKVNLYSLLLSIIPLLFHRSVVLPIVIVWLLVLFPKLKINKWIVLICWLGSHVFGDIISQNLMPTLWPMVNILNYDTLYERIDEFSVYYKHRTGIGIILKSVVNLIVIYFATDIVNKENNKTYYIFYLLFLVGLLFEPIVETNILMRRLNLFFIFMQFVVYAYTSAYLWLYKKGYNLMYLLMILLSSIALYIMAIISNSNNCVPYRSVLSL